MTTIDRPLVSILMHVRNAARSVRRAVDSVLAQTYPNIEYVVQDGASTDGTLEILREYGDRIKLVSEPDSGPIEGFQRVVDRCTGAFVGLCLSDEELLPDAVEVAVRIFQENPAVGAVTGDALITDIDGKITGSWTSGPFTLVDYLLAEYTPYLVSSFFRRDVLDATGWNTRTWNPNCLEFELWCRMATTSQVLYVPHVFAKYAQHPGQLSNTHKDALIHIEGRLANITALCAPGGFFDDQPLLRTLFFWSHARIFGNHALVIGMPEMAHAAYEMIKRALGEHPPVFLDGILYDENYERHLADAREREKGDDGLWRRAGARLSATLARLGNREAPKPKESLTLPPPPDARLKSVLYAQEALCHEARGNLSAASECWHAAAIAAGSITPAQAGRRTDKKYGWAGVSS
jgi:glycosyltransferase involved in cell wall biosynthesis